MSNYSIRLKKVSVTNVVTHKDSTFNFDNGISVVRGKNASGKSVLFSTIGNLFYGTPPLSTKKNNAKQMFNKNGIIELELEKDNDTYKIKQYLKGSSVKYEVSKNDKNLEFHTIANAQDKIGQIFPLSQDQFYTTLYLTSYRSSAHVLLNGSGPQRKEFFENFFNLHHYDIIYDLLREKYSDLKNKITKANSIEEEKANLESQLHKVDINSVREKARLLKKLQHRYTKYSDRVLKIENYRSIQSTLKTDYDKKQIQELMLLIHNKILDYKGKLKEGIKNQTINVEYKKIKSKRKEYELELKNLKYKEIKNSSSKIQNNIYKLKQELKELEEINQTWIKHNQLGEKLPEKFKTCKSDALLLKDKILGRISNSKQIIVKMGKLKNKESCPTCNSKLNTREINLILKQAQSDINKYENYVDCLKYIEPYYDTIVDNKPNKIKNIKNKLIDLNKDYEDAEKQEKINVKYEKITDLLNGLPHIKQVESVDISALEDKIKKQEKKLDFYKAEYQKLKSLSSIKIKHLDKYEEMKTYLLSNEGKLREFSEELGKLKAYLISDKQNKRRIKVLNKELDMINKASKKGKLYEALIKAYGPKGIKIAQINNLAEIFCNQLNTYANLLFPEDITFNAVVDTNNFNILATRDGLTADVQTLSGAQSRCYQLLCVMVLLSFIPKRYKVDTLILDELEAGMSDVIRNKFANEFLPQLQTLIPNIVVITPLNSKTFYISNAKEYEVVKHKNISTIKEC